MATLECTFAEYLHLFAGLQDFSSLSTFKSSSLKSGYLGMVFHFFVFQNFYLIIVLAVIVSNNSAKHMDA